MSLSIEITNLSKKFGRRMAVEPLNLSIPQGSIYGLLGHNGAGKSTTIGMVLGQVFPDTGSIRINGFDVFENRAAALAKVGAIFESYAFYDYLSGWRNLKICCEYTAPCDRQRLDEVIALVGLEKRIGDRAGTYSHGMKQRLALAQALLPNPNILILDEPADGLDPVGILEMRQLIRRLNRELGMTVLFSSHQLHEVQELSTHLAVMHQGKLVFSGLWEPQNAPTGWLRVHSSDQQNAIAGLRAAGLLCEIDGQHRVKLAAGAQVSQVARWLFEHGHEIHELSVLQASLEDFYLHVTGQHMPKDNSDQWRKPTFTEPATATVEK